MSTTDRHKEIEALERAFWNSMIDRKPEVATQMLAEPALMVSEHGVTKFDHAAFTEMAKNDRYKLIDYTLANMDVVFPREDVAVASYQVNQLMEMEGRSVQMDVYDTSTWLKLDGQWRCVMHTESPAAKPH